MNTSVATESRAADVAVIGGGVIGLASAWRLAQRGLLVTLVDPAPARGATHAAAGMLAPASEVTYGETDQLRLATESMARYADFVAELEALSGLSVGLRREGTVLVATDAGDRSLLVELHAFQTSLGLPATLLSSRECRTVEPLLSPEVRCGLLIASDHSVDNRRLAQALLRAATNAGVRMVAQAVGSIATDEAGAVCGLDLADGSRIAAGTVVLAAGAWSGQVPGVAVAARPQVHPVKGQIVRLRATSNVLLPGHTIRGIVNGRSIYLVPRIDGELVVGATVEDRGFDTAVTAGGIRELLRDARAVMPAVDELEFGEAVASLRPGSPDNAPSIGPTAVDGLVLATGHYRNGILMTPLTADLVAAVITASATDSDRELLALTSPRRFEPATARP